MKKTTHHQPHIRRFPQSPVVVMYVQQSLLLRLAEASNPIVRCLAPLSRSVPLHDFLHYTCKVQHR